MEWPLFLLIIGSSLLFLFLMGMPIALSFFAVIIVGAPMMWGLGPGMSQFIHSISDSLINFSLLPIPLYVLMGEVIFNSKIAPDMIDALDKWIGRLPGRLSLMAVGAGTLFATLTGTSIASTAMLGRSLVPEMEKKGYQKSMSIGPILGSGGLAIMIPPSTLAVLMCAVGEISIGQTLIAITTPGVMMAFLYGGYIILRSVFKPSLAPAYSVEHSTLSEKLTAFAKYILPVGFIIFMVVGVIYVGIATPTEAAATGALGCFLFSLLHGRLSFDVINKSMTGTVKVTAMVYLIVAGSDLFSQMLAYSGVVNGLSEIALGFPEHRVLVFIAMQLIVFLLGMFMNSLSIMMITLPIFMPVVQVLEFNPVWFGVMYLINIETGAITPPFGLALFVMKGVAPKDTTMADIWLAAVPYILLNILAIVLIYIFPQIAMWFVMTMH
ncbi:MAG: C4-dicarboxylate ABC transporter permease [Deltaproteobacteria bacterium RBG_13_47_9]|nr:MAG: C4-dicarboxylate ABC transporter permease [Deltaproteobacteria bacterium RBG_13_47_9]